MADDEVLTWAKEYRNRGNGAKKYSNGRDVRRHKSAVLKHAYGIAIEEYEGMLTKQAGRCLICNVLYGCGLVVDHDKETMHIRGLLCDRCNIGIAKFREDVIVLKKAICYLIENHKIEREIRHERFIRKQYEPTKLLTARPGFH